MDFGWFITHWGKFLEWVIGGYIFGGGSPLGSIWSG